MIIWKSEKSFRPCRLGNGAGQRARAQTEQIWNGTFAANKERKPPLISASNQITLLWLKQRLSTDRAFFSLHQRDSQWHFHLILAKIVCMVWGPIFFSSIFLVFNLLIKLGPSCPFGRLDPSARVAWIRSWRVYEGFWCLLATAAFCIYTGLNAFGRKSSQSINQLLTESEFPVTF